MFPLPDTSFPAESGRVGEADVSQVGRDLSHILGNVCQQQVKDVISFMWTVHPMKGEEHRNPQLYLRAQTHFLLCGEMHGEVAG